jgi:hypothetical protein
MNEEHGDYLWDRSGTADPLIERLEQVLASFRHEARSGAPEAWTGGPPVLAARTAAQRWRWQWLPLAAGLALAAGAMWLVLIPRRMEQTPGCLIVSATGSAAVDASTLNTGARLYPGAWLTTGPDGTVTLSIGTIGSVTVSARSRLRLVESEAHSQRLELARGVIEASITAPPRIFVVETPSATAVDLGCQYRLEVEDDGTALLEVSLGRVALERGETVAIVPREARCRTRPALFARPGPGLPHFDDASERFKAAVTLYEADPASESAIAMMLDEARPRDSLTLWHLLQRIGQPQRQRVLERTLALVPLPDDVDRDAALRLDRDALDAWWTAMYGAWYGYRR